jgi:hypothetical protein
MDSTLLEAGTEVFIREILASYSFCYFCTLICVEVSFVLGVVQKGLLTLY